MYKNVKIAYLLFLFVLSKYKICLTFCCQHGKVSQREKKDICHLYVYVKYEQNRWLRHCIIKSVFHETKQFNFPEKNVPSQTCLTWVSDHFAVGVEHPSRTTFFSILILLCHSCTGLWAKPCRAAPTSLKYDFKDASERLDNLFIDTTTLK